MVIIIHEYIYCYKCSSFTAGWCVHLTNVRKIIDLPTVQDWKYYYIPKSWANNKVFKKSGLIGSLCQVNKSQ